MLSAFAVMAVLLAADPAAATPPAPRPVSAAVLSRDDERLVAIKANATMVIAQLGPASEMAFGYDKASVEWLDGFIERQRVRMGGDGERMTDVLGSYLGEAIIARTGGA